MADSYFGGSPSGYFDTLSAPQSSPNDYMINALGSLFGGDRNAYNWAHRATNLLNWTPAGLPQAFYDAGQQVGLGAKSFGQGNVGSGMAHSGLALATALMAGMPGGKGRAADALASRAVRLFGDEAPDAAAMARMGMTPSGSDWAPAAPGQVNPSASPYVIPQRLWSNKEGRQFWQPGQPFPSVDVASMEMSPNDLFTKGVDLFRTYPNTPLKTALKGTTSEVYNAAHQHMVNNILAIHDAIPPEDRQNWMQWYDGARRVVDDWSQRYNLPPHAIAGTMAILSPQKDWFQNVSLAQRLLDAHWGGRNLNTPGANFQMPTVYNNHVLDPAMEAEFNGTKSMKDYKGIFDQIRGKTMADIDATPGITATDASKALWLRLYDEAHNDRGYRSLNSDGTFGDFVTNKNGANSQVAAGTFDQMSRALQLIDAARGGDMNRISELLGDRHKVRNFYNNIIDPMSPNGDVTIDTHAVAAALMRPLSQSHAEVLHNFKTSPASDNPIAGFVGAPGSAVSGISGTYPLYADAYREAALMRGLTPRQMQSITWEGVRNMFPDTFKTQKNVDAINGIWNNYRAGKISQQEAQSRVFNYAKANGGGAPARAGGAGVLPQE